ncbi:hypothetical protein HEK616_61090 [Streptomyces nigrescens]|uniref:Secreted protein n=2 Tax=Streptomyces TaxID=1883 RepID=A0ABM8A260_STRNI|nr:hypothetical protein [Streptomyces nigrescens]MEE4423601.1 hypothetical protein [Streptomyces sp. DSM 41528]BDM72622.1 hypothetical protein HEK616_61090 [Streptomyces nigrescens]
MPSHARPKPSRVPRTLLRAGLVVSAAGAALAGGGAATAGAAPASAPHHGPDHGPGRPGPDRHSTDTGATASALTGALLNSAAGGVGPLKNIQVDPLANTPVDPLANAVGTQVADFKPLSTTLVTGSLSRGAAIRDVPLVNKVERILPG